MYTHVLFIRKSMRLEMILLNRIQVGESKFRQCSQEGKLDYVLWVPTCLNLNVLDTLLSNLIYCTSLGNPYSQKLKLFSTYLGALHLINAINKSQQYNLHIINSEVFYSRSILGAKMSQMKNYRRNDLWIKF